MGKTFNVSVVIGAAFAGSFKTTIGGAMKQMDAMGSAIRKMESTRVDIDSFKKLKHDLDASKSSLAEAQASVGKLAREMKTADQAVAALGGDLKSAKEKLDSLSAGLKGVKRPTDEMKSALASAKTEVSRLSQEEKAARQNAASLGKEFEAAKTRAASLKDQVNNQSESLHRLRQGLSSAGIDTRSLAADQMKLGKSLEHVRSVQMKLGSALAAQKANLEKRGQLRGQLFDSFALGASLALPLKGAIDFESAMADVRKTVDFAQPDGLIKLGNALKEMSRTIPVSASGLGQIAAAGGQLGVAEKDLTRFTTSVAKMSTAFDVLPERAGEAMAKMANAYQIPIDKIDLLGDAINVLGNNSVSRERDIVEALTRVGGVGRIFGLSAVQVAALTSSMISLGKEPEVAARGVNAVLTKLKIASQLSDKADAAMKNYLHMTGEEIEELVAKDPQGGLIKVLEKVKALESGDQMKLLSKMFGAEWSDDMAMLVGSLDEYKKQLAMVADETKFAGSMQREFENRANTTANKLQLLKNRAEEVGTNLGTIFLPGVNAAADGLGQSSSAIADFATRFPVVTKVVGGALAGLVGLKVASIGLGYAWTFVKGGALQLGTVFRKLQAGIALARGGMAGFGASPGGTAFGSFGSKIAGMGSAITGFARSAVPIAITAVRSLGATMVSTPLGAIIAGIAAGAFLVYKYWEPIKSFFGGLWQGIKEGFSGAFSGIGDAFAPLQPVFDGIVQAIEWVVPRIKILGKWFGDLLSPVDASSETLKQCASVGEAVGQVLGTVLGGAVRILITPFEMLGSAVKVVWGLFESSPVQAVISGMGQIKTWLENFSLADVGRKVIGTFVDGVKSVGSAVKDAISSVFSSADPVFPHSDAREGPFSRLTDSGRALVVTFGDGIRAASGSVLDPIGRVFADASRLMNRPLSLAAGLTPNFGLPDFVGNARKMIGAAALSVPLALQPALATPAVQSMLDLPKLGSTVKWDTIAPRLPVLPDLQGRASWKGDAPEAPALPELGGVVGWESQEPVPDMASGGRDSGVERDRSRAPVPNITMGDIIIHATPGMDEAQLAEKVRAQVRAELDQAMKRLESERRAALYD